MMLGGTPMKSKIFSDWTIVASSFGQLFSVIWGQTSEVVWGFSKISIN